MSIKDKLSENDMDILASFHEKMGAAAEILNKFPPCHQHNMVIIKLEEAAHWMQSLIGNHDTIQQH